MPQKKRNLVYSKISGWVELLKPSCMIAVHVSATSLEISPSSEPWRQWELENSQHQCIGLWDKSFTIIFKSCFQPRGGDTSSGVEGHLRNSHKHLQGASLPTPDGLYAAKNSWSIDNRTLGRPWSRFFIKERYSRCFRLPMLPGILENKHTHQMQKNMHAWLSKPLLKLSRRSSDLNPFDLSNYQWRHATSKHSRLAGNSVISSNDC